VTRACTRRAFGGLAGAACLVCASKAPAAPGPGAPRVVVIGGGAGGATAARYLAMAEKPINVTLVEPKTRFTTCFGSNLYLAGLRTFDSLTHGYETLAARYGVHVVHDRALQIDAAARRVRLGGGNIIPYDRLVLAPGISLRYDGFAGYSEAAAEVMPHAWEAGPQSILLRQQLEAMPDGGVFLIVAPPEPYRCPPGPYERASLVAAYFKQNKKRAKILIIDSKDTFFEQDLFQEGWNRHYPGMIEWLPAQFTGGIQSVNAAKRGVRTASGTFTANVANVIPPQTAAALARDTGLADAGGWCPVDPTSFESRLQRDIHVVGDAINPGAMPKSAFAANSQAKACAFAIAAALTGADPVRPFLYNTCYTYLAPDDAVSDAISFRDNAGKIAIANIEISPVETSTEIRAKSVREANGWYDTFSRDIFG